MSRATKISNKKQNVSVLKSVITKLIAVMLIQISSVLLICMFFYLTDRDVNNSFAIIIISCSVASFVSAYFIGKIIRKNGMIYGIVYNLPVTAIFLLVSLILNNFSFDSRIIIFPSLQVIASAVGGITAVNTKSKSRRSR